MYRVDVIVKSSIGKKLLMAGTGFGFLGFLAIHLAGMMTLYQSQEELVAYGEKLHFLGDFSIVLVEWGLLLCACIHVGIGLTLFIQNNRARPVRYRVTTSAGGQTLASKTMPYTGLCILVFLLVHLAHFRFAGSFSNTAEMFGVVSASFKNGVYSIIYVPAMLALGLHVSHGFWSAFQTIGLKHYRLMPFLRVIGLLFSLLLTLGFGSIPLYFLLFH